MKGYADVEIDPYDPLLTPSESVAVKRMIEMCNIYIVEGDPVKVKVAKKMLHIFWQSLKGFVPNLGESAFGDL